ncbi:MAG TPA: TIGR01777 family oxidoreductase [Bacteriovoracaceae bacterium]|nr:TIGR01777 family oxidoreductase [Bacteriovoracaceae bacterium]
MRVLVTGATGFVGQVLVRQLLDQHHEVVILTRNIPKAAIVLGSRCKYFQWSNISEPAPLEAFEGVDGVVNLMGENIGSRRWSPEQKKVIYNSRIDGTARLIDTIAKLENKPSVFVSASAIGVYGSRGPEELTENSPVGEGFLAHVCRDWEEQAFRALELGMRVAVIRTGVVLGRNGGVLDRMLPIFKVGLGGPMGEGNQYMSWIHVEDLAAMYVEALINKNISGVNNGTAPYPATNSDFTKALGKVLKKPTALRAPRFVLKKALGEMSTLVLDGQKVLPSKFKSENFRYRYPTLDMALKETAY